MIVTTLLVLLYLAAGVFTLPKIVRALAKSLRATWEPQPLDISEQFGCFMFGLFLSAAWPLPALFLVVRHFLFPEEQTQ